MPTSYLTLNLTADHAVPVQPGGGTATVTVTSGASVYYSTDADINATHNEGTLVLSTPVAFTGPVWLRSAGVSTVTVQLDPPSSGGSGGSGGGVLLSTATLASPGTIDVLGVNQTYNDLILILIARSTVAIPNDTPWFVLNNDVTNTYYREFMPAAGSGTAVNSGENRNDNQIKGGNIAGSTAPANSFGVCELTLYGYTSTAWFKTAHWRTMALGAVTTGNIFYYSGASTWNSTAAINRITVSGSGPANLDVGSQLRIYGRL